MRLQSTAPVLFESSDNLATQQDPANQDWVALIRALEGSSIERLARRYYLALCHFRQRRLRPPLPGVIEIEAPNRQGALQGILAAMEQRKANRKQHDATPDEVFVDPRPDLSDPTLPAALRDLALAPPPLNVILGGAGRPPCDALCLLRAFLAAPLLGVGDAPTSVFQVLRSNPTFAHLCGFLGRSVLKQSGELTSRQLPSLSVCAEFSEVMTRYGLWHLARLEQVRDNLTAGLVTPEDTVAFDTTHVIAHSHCANVVPADAQVDPGQPPKARKVPRMTKRCGCGREQWEECEHPWVPTDQGAAVVVKGKTRVYWAHKASLMSLGRSEIPIDVRVCRYAAESDGKTLVPHLELLKIDLPEFIASVRFVLADDAYQDNRAAVSGFGQQARLIVPVHGRQARASLAAQYAGIDHFTAIGVPVCQGGQRFVFFGRDLEHERFLWAAPMDDHGQPVCASCPHASTCLQHGGRRHLRVPRADQPQIDWEHPQHFARDRARYARRTGVERAIKRLKVDLQGEVLTHRHGLRVQASLDRKLLTLHLLLKNAASP
jgi:hypothetical protein